MKKPYLVLFSVAALVSSYFVLRSYKPEILPAKVQSVGHSKVSTKAPNGKLSDAPAEAVTPKIQDSEGPDLATATVLDLENYLTRVDAIRKLNAQEATQEEMDQYQRIFEKLDQMRTASVHEQLVKLQDEVEEYSKIHADRVEKYRHGQKDRS